MLTTYVRDKFAFGQRSPIIMLICVDKTLEWKWSSLVGIKSINNGTKRDEKKIDFYMRIIHIETIIAVICFRRIMKRMFGIQFRSSCLFDFMFFSNLILIFRYRGFIRSRRNILWWMYGGITLSPIKIVITKNKTYLQCKKEKKKQQIQFQFIWCSLHLWNYVFFYRFHSFKL